MKKLRILYFGNNWVSYEILKFLKEQHENVIGLVMHPKTESKFRTKNVELFPEVEVIEGNNESLRSRRVIDKIRKLKPDLFLSVYFGYILTSELLSIPTKAPLGAINLHPAYLPFGKGANPNVWSIVKNEPSGVTLHYMNEKIDKGSIIARKKIEVEMTDTGKTLYKKCEREGIQLFKDTWEYIKLDKIIPVILSENLGSFHYIKDFHELYELDTTKKYDVIELFDIVRAKTFAPYKGISFVKDGRRYYVRIEIEEEEYR